MLSRHITSAVTEESFTIYPNPLTGNEFTFRLSNAPPDRYISFIVTPAGQQVKQKLIEHINGDLIRPVDLSGLPAGIYRLVLRSSTQKFTQQIVYVN